MNESSTNHTEIRGFIAWQIQSYMLSSVLFFVEFFCSRLSLKRVAHSVFKEINNSWVYGLRGEKCIQSWFLQGRAWSVRNAWTGPWLLLPLCHLHHLFIRIVASRFFFWQFCLFQQCVRLQIYQTRTSNLNLEDDWERGVFIFTIILNIIMLKRF
jgi:hypothetical protein